MTTIRTAVLTGSTSGIGLATAGLLASRVDRLILLGPEPEAAVLDVLDRLAARRHAARLLYVPADFAEMDRVGEAAGRILAATPSIDLLVNNAGVPGAETRRMTGDGNERTLQVNALAPAALTWSLLGGISPGGRIVNVGSSAHRFAALDPEDLDQERAYSPTTAYCASKSVVIAWTLWLARHLRDRDVSAITLCPGLTDTALARSMVGPLDASAPVVAARRVVHAATAQLPSGSYLEHGHVTRPDSHLGSRTTQDLVARLVLARIGAEAR